MSSSRILFPTIVYLSCIIIGVVAILSATFISASETSFLSEEDDQLLGSDPSESYCIFQYKYKAENDEEMDAYPLAPYSFPSLLKNILTDEFPWLNATYQNQFLEVFFNVTYASNGGGNNNNGNNATTSTTTTVTTSTPSPNTAYTPIMGCRAMLQKMNGSTTKNSNGVTVNYKMQYNVTDAWIGFRPASVPFWMRKPINQPEMLYIALGSVSSLLILVQVVYGIYHSWSNKGTLESIGSD